MRAPPALVRRSPALVLLVVLVLLGGASPRLAADEVALAGEPVVLEGLGLSVRVPVGAVVARDVAGDAVALLIADRVESPRWRLRIGILEADAATPTARMITQDHLNRREAARRSFTVLANDPTRVGEREGHLLVLQEEGPEGTPVVNGWLVLPRSGLTFVVATLATVPGDIAAARPVLEAVMGSLELEEMETLVAERRARLEAGAAFLRTLTPDRLRSLVGHEAWYRMHRVETGGDREIGYMQVVAREGRRGELEPNRDPARYTPSEEAEGLLLLIRSRILLDPSGKGALDVDGRYWLAWDRGEEAWSSRTTERSEGIERSRAQTGIRTSGVVGGPSVLSVVNQETAGRRAERSPVREWTVPGETYLSMPEAILLGQLLPRDGSIDGTLSFHWFDAAANRVPIRTDRWTPDPATPGHWVLVTHPALDEAGPRQEFDQAGRRLRRVDGDGVITERIEAGELRRLWASKGLPTS